MNKKLSLYESYESHGATTEATLTAHGTPLDIFKALPMTPEEKLKAALEENKKRLRYGTPKTGEKYLSPYLVTSRGDYADAKYLILDPEPDPPNAQDAKECDMKTAVVTTNKDGDWVLSGTAEQVLEAGLKLVKGRLRYGIPQEGDTVVTIHQGVFKANPGWITEAHILDPAPVPETDPVKKFRSVLKDDEPTALAVWPLPEEPKEPKKCKVCFFRYNKEPQNTFCEMFGKQPSVPCCFWERCPGPDDPWQAWCERRPNPSHYGIGEDFHSALVQWHKTQPKPKEGQ